MWLLVHVYPRVAVSGTGNESWYYENGCDAVQLNNLEIHFISTSFANKWNYWLSDNFRADSILERMTQELRTSMWTLHLTSLSLERFASFCFPGQDTHFTGYGAVQISQLLDVAF